MISWIGMMTGNSVKTVWGVIPARWASTRLPGKPLVSIMGRPLIHWVIERVRQAKNLAGVLVATDDERIRVAAQAVGAEVAMTRSDHPSGTDRVAEAVAAIAADVVINIQGDEPLVDPALIDAIAASLTDPASEWDMVTAAERMVDEADICNPNIVKAVFDENGRALYFSRAAIPHVRDPDESDPVDYWRHIGIYGYSRSFLARLVAAAPCMLERVERLEQLRALFIGGRIGVIEAAQSGLGIDTPEDIVMVERYLKESGELGRECNEAR